MNQGPTNLEAVESYPEPELGELDEKEDLNAPQTSPLIEELEILLALTFFGIAGSMARNGLVQLTKFENLGSVWPNFAGCFIISCSPSMFGPVLAPVVATGLCGSLTSFSELITDIFLESTTPQLNWPDYGYGVPLFQARLILEICCCFGGYLSGAHFGQLWTTLKVPILSEKKERILRKILGAFGVAAWVVCLVTAITSPNRSRWWPLNGLFAPFGVWLRYYLSKINHPSVWFKWGTFAANATGTFLACVFQTCVLLDSPTDLQKQFLIALQRGFCGCLSTISTFIKELNSLKTLHAYIYGIISLFVGYSFSFIIIGSYKWTR